MAEKGHGPTISFTQRIAGVYAKDTDEASILRRRLAVVSPMNKLTGDQYCEDLLLSTLCGESDKICGRNASGDCKLYDDPPDVSMS